MRSLNRFYLDRVAPLDTQCMVDLHTPVNGGRVDTLCNVTAASIAWLLTGKDLAPPFSGAWHHAAEGTGPEGVDRLIAYGPDDGETCFFDEAHVLLMLHRDGLTLQVDSHWAERRTLTLREVDAAPNPDLGQRARYILLSASEGLGDAPPRPTETAPSETPSETPLVNCPITPI